MSAALTDTPPEPRVGPEPRRPLGWQVPTAAVALLFWVAMLVWMAYLR